MSDFPGEKMMTRRGVPRGQNDVDKSPKRLLSPSDDDYDFDGDPSDRILVKIAAFLLIAIPVAIIVFKALR